MRISASNCIEHRESLVLKLHTSISHIHERNRDRVNANVNLFPIKFSFHETFWCENLLFIALIFYWSIHESNAKVVGCERCALTHVEIQVLFNGVIFFLIPRKALSVFFLRIVHKSLMKETLDCYINGGKWNSFMRIENFVAIHSMEFTKMQSKRCANV